MQEQELSSHVWPLGQVIGVHVSGSTWPTSLSFLTLVEFLLDLVKVGCATVREKIDKNTNIGKSKANVFKIDGFLTISV